MLCWEYWRLLICHLKVIWKFDVLFWDVNSWNLQRVRVRLTGWNEMIQCGMFFSEWTDCGRVALHPLEAAGSHGHQTGQRVHLPRVQWRLFDPPWQRRRFRRAGRRLRLGDLQNRRSGPRYFGCAACRRRRRLSLPPRRDPAGELFSPDQSRHLLPRSHHLRGNNHLPPPASNLYQLIELTRVVICRWPAAGLYQRTVKSGTRSGKEDYPTWVATRSNCTVCWSRWSIRIRRRGRRHRR